MKLIVDENISFAKEAFSGLGEVVLMQGREITNDSLKDADFLIVRSVTKVNEKLLKNTPVKFVGTATIGTDHIDLEYLKSAGIAFADAKGCNADAVAEYVFTSVLHSAFKYGMSLKGKTIGIVGVGNIGSRIVRLAEVLEMNVIKNDPPLKRKTGDAGYRELSEIFDADIITMHVPLNKEGIDKTVHLIDAEKLEKLKDGTFLINASRGQVIDNSALCNLLDSKKLRVNLDVWENEPLINTDLLNKIDIASPHIAGYSLEGKVNGTSMIYYALCRFLNISPSWKPELPQPENNFINADSNISREQCLQNIFSGIYDIALDDKAMRAMNEVSDADKGKYFDGLRKNYPLRREFTNYSIEISPANKQLENILKEFRFKILNS